MRTQRPKRNESTYSWKNQGHYEHFFLNLFIKYHQFVISNFISWFVHFPFKLFKEYEDGYLRLQPPAL